MVDFVTGVRIISLRFFFDGDGEIALILFFLFVFEVTESEEEGFCSNVPLFIVMSLNEILMMFSRNFAGFIFERSYVILSPLELCCGAIAMNFDINISLFVTVRISAVKISLALSRLLNEDVAEDEDKVFLISSMFVRSTLRRSGVLFRARTMVIETNLIWLFNCLLLFEIQNFTDNVKQNYGITEIKKIKK